MNIAKTLFISSCRLLMAGSVLFTLPLSAYSDDVIKSPIFSMTSLSKSENVLRGQLRARQFTTIAAGIAGKLTRFPVTHGQRIKKGQTIATFDCRMEAAEKAVAVAKLNGAQSKLEVNTQLAKYKNISTLEVTLAKSEVAIQKAELNRARAILANCKISAPFSAIVASKIAQAHQYVKEGDPLLEIIDTSSLEVEMVIPSRWLQKMPKGTDFSIQLDEFATPINAKIDRNVGAIDPVSQTIRVIGKLVNPPKELLPGMSGEIKFATPSSPVNAVNPKK
ncbi:MAG: efflux RND transporter periplasmic adaptor subunit [Methylococcaceae bacterium]|nr:efflux RND transporter periplasmic adaptor subunit [Methylococcaceae bacterium]